MLSNYIPRKCQLKTFVKVVSNKVKERSEMDSSGWNSSFHFRGKLFIFVKLFLSNKFSAHSDCTVSMYFRAWKQNSQRRTQEVKTLGSNYIPRKCRNSSFHFRKNLCESCLNLCLICCVQTLLSSYMSVVVVIIYVVICYNIFLNMY